LQQSGAARVPAQDGDTVSGAEMDASKAAIDGAKQLTR
jgi:hypothetical protein